MSTVSAIKDLNKVTQIKDWLTKHKSEQYADIFTFGINTALRISDLLSIKFADIETIDGKSSITIIEEKTNKTRVIPLNAAALEIVAKRKKQHPKDVYLFQSHSNRGRGKVAPLSRMAVGRAFKECGEAESIQVKINTHSMRKTRGYHLYMQSGKNIGLVQKLLNHSSSAATLAYIGVCDQDVADSYCLNL